MLGKELHFKNAPVNYADTLRQKSQMGKIDVVWNCNPTSCWERNIWGNKIINLQPDNRKEMTQQKINFLK
jgi:hypothetical protein